MEAPRERHAGIDTAAWYVWLKDVMVRRKLDMPFDFERNWPTMRLGIGDVWARVKRLHEDLNEGGLVVLAEALKARRAAIIAEKTDPYWNGWEPASWRDADVMLERYRNVLVNGGNRAAKTEYACKRAVQSLVEGEGRQAWFFHTTARTSIRYLQPVVWKYLPREWKDAKFKKTVVAKLSYTMANGFTDATFVLPNRSQGFFFNYEQDRNVIEGGEPDFIVCDELVPRDWVETLLMRVTKRPKLLVTFTPVHGRTPTVRSYYAGMKVLESRPSPLLPGRNVDGVEAGRMPYRAEGMSGAAGIIWFFSEWNPYSPYEEIVNVCRGKPRGFVMERAYGYAPSDAMRRFPLFGGVNIVPADLVPVEGTNWQSVDPASSRNSYMLWLRACEDGTLWAYREWPTERWAETGDDNEGRIGPGQVNGAGRGTLEYKRLIMGLEGWDTEKLEPGGEEVFRRFMDPRAGKAPQDGAERTRSRLELFDSEDYSPKGELVGPRMTFFPASGGKDIDFGIGLVNEWLAYDPEREVSADNHPKLYVSEACPNLIWALKEYTGCSLSEACKDPIDALRYLACERVRYLGGGVMSVVEGRGF